MSCHAQQIIVDPLMHLSVIKVAIAKKVKSLIAFLYTLGFK